MAQAQQDSPWLHIRVTDNDEGSKVSVNLPLSLVEIALEIAEAEIQRQSHVHFHDSDVTVEDLRRMWNELRDAGDADFVTVDEGDERIQISRQADKVLIQMTELESGEQKGRIEVPVTVVDALLSGDGEALNLRGALDELIRTQQGEIVMIDHDDAYVRILIE